MRSCYVLLLCLCLSAVGLAQTQMDLPITFEDDNVDYGLADFAGASSQLVEDPTDNTNTVVSTTKMVDALVFAGTTLTSVSGLPDGFASPIPFSEDGTIISVRVWSPEAGVPVRLKVENVDRAATSVETELTTTVAMQWETLNFNFRNNVANTPALNLDSTYQKAIIFFDFGTVGTEDVTYFWDDMIFTNTTAGMPSPMVAAPAPERDPATVISLFSDAYDDVPVNTFRADFGASAFTDTSVAMNATLLYENLNFAGIETLDDNTIDLMAAGMTHIHMDVWTPDANIFRVKLVDFGGDGFMGAGTDTEGEVETNPAKGSWVSLDLPLAGFGAMNMDDIAQIVISADPANSTVWIDNIYYYAGEELGAQMDLPVDFESDSIDYGVRDFGGATSMIVTDPTDMNNTVVQTIKNAGAETFAGTSITSTAGGPTGFVSRIPITEDNSTMSVRVWSPTAGTPVRLKIENASVPEISVETQVLTEVAMAWDTLVFDFRNEAEGTAAVNFASDYRLATIFFDFGTNPAEAATYFWDDVAAGGTSDGGGGNEEMVPMTAAPVPAARRDSNVFSVYSDAYTDVTINTLFAAFSQAAFEEVTIEGQAAAKYSNLGFAGIEFLDANALNLEDANMETFHFDYWSPNLTTLRIKLVDFGGDGFQGANPDTEVEIAITVTPNQWNPITLPLTDFAAMNQMDVTQIVISGDAATGPGTGTLYLDNIFFSKNPVSTNNPVVGLLEAFPNPVTDRMLLKAPSRMETVTVYAITGEVMGRWVPNADQQELDLSSYAPGMYVALVQAEDGQAMTIKLVKE